MSALTSQTTESLADEMKVEGTARATQAELELSVIVIGRNESTRIGRCLASILKSLQGVESFEVIYVDSDSQDDSVDVASQFPVRILQLRPEWSLSPSAGRYIGYLNARGKYLMFVDGDTVLYKRWMSEGLEYLRTHPDCGGVAGLVHELVQDERGVCTDVVKDKYFQCDSDGPQEAFSLGGIAMYPRSAMNAVGTFNPFIKTGEEGEVGLRIREAGYHLRWVNTPMCLTYAPPRESLRELVRRSKTSLYQYGPALRYCLENGNFTQYVREELWYVCTFVAAMFAGSVLILATVLSGTIWPLVLLLAAAAILVLWKKKSPKFLFVSILKRSLITYQTVVSFFTARAKPVESYPTDAIVVK